MKRNPSPHRGKRALAGEQHRNAKLDWEKVRFIRENPRNLTIGQLAKKFGVGISTIHSVQKYETWVKEPRFTCPRCKMTSFNKNDIEHGYCGNCHDWTRYG